jgi:hypothetical protein
MHDEPNNYLQIWQRFVCTCRHCSATTLAVSDNEVFDLRCRECHVIAKHMTQLVTDQVYDVYVFGWSLCACRKSEVMQATLAEATVAGGAVSRCSTVPFRATRRKRPRSAKRPLAPNLPTRPPACLVHHVTNYWPHPLQRMLLLCDDLHLASSSITAASMYSLA